MKIKYYVLYNKVADLYYQGGGLWATDIEFGERYKNPAIARNQAKNIKGIDVCILKVKIKEIKV